MRTLIAAAAALSLAAPPASACANMPQIASTTDYNGQCRTLAVFNQDLSTSCPDTARLVTHVSATNDAFLVLQIGNERRVRFSGRLIESPGGTAQLLLTSVTDARILPNGNQPSTTREARGQCNFTAAGQNGTGSIFCSVSGDDQSSTLVFRFMNPPVMQRLAPSNATPAPTGTPCLPNEN
jgi:hypothetical protein